MDYTSYDSFVDFDIDMDSAKATFNNPTVASKPVKVVRKKFAVPPVKVACLEW
jgi:hypothetical protein